MALDVGGVEHSGASSLGTEATSCLLAVVNEILTPNLDGGVTILRSISRIECIDVSRLVEAELRLIDTVSEVSSHRNLEAHLPVGDHRRTVVALQAAELLQN